MRTFLRCLGEAVAAKGLRVIAGIAPMGEHVFDLAAYVIERYRRHRQDARLRRDVEELMQASAKQIREEARRIVNEVLPDGTAEEVSKLEEFLSQVPALARRTLTGVNAAQRKMVAPSVDLLNPMQLSCLIPSRVSQFQQGQSVPGAPQWRFTEFLGAGGFGEVWLAEHTFLEKRRAFKFCLNSNARERLLRHEGEIVKRVMAANPIFRPDQHGIVILEDVYFDGEPPWLAYEYIDGGDLSQIVREQAEANPEVRGRILVRLWIELAEVIGRFHILPEPIIHRDLKPANILLKPVGATWLIRVTDFGISHVTAQTNLRQSMVSSAQMSLAATYRGAHTPIYASPQQKRGHRPDVRDDVYALGIIAWQLFLGDFTAERPAGKWRKRLASMNLPSAILDRVESCWDDDPDERPANAAVLADQLRFIGRVWDDYSDLLASLNRGGSVKSWLMQNVHSLGIWQRGADQRIPEAMVLLGACYPHGIGVPFDPVEAMKWFRLAADAGDAFAANNIGWMYYSGKGVPRDPAEAANWYRQAAELGNPSAMNNLAWLYRNGSGVVKNPIEALRWIERAAELGSAAAMNQIGWAYQQGNGYPRNDAKAIEWFLRAANLGYSQSMVNIGYCYKYGRGVRKDAQTANEWFQRARDAGRIIPEWLLS